MKIKYILSIVVTTFFAIFFIACGDGRVDKLLNALEYDISSAFKGQNAASAPSSETEHKLLLDLTKRWAPELRMHSKEQYPLANVNEFLKYVGMLSKYNNQDRVIVPPGKLTLTGKTGLLSQVVDVGNKKYEMSGGDYTAPTLQNLVLYIPQKVVDKTGQERDVYQDIIKGSGVAASITKDPKCYAYPHYVDNRTAIEINYWFFYPYNGWVFSGIIGVGALLENLQAGTHECDWEHMTVRLSADGKRLEGIFYSAHGAAESHWYYTQNSDLKSKTGYKLNSKGHPIAWSALDTHGVHNNPGEQRRKPDDKILGEIVKYSGALVDLTDDGGKWIDCENHLAIFDFENLPAELQWVYYHGRWGATEGGKPGTGPEGPILKDSWIKEEKFDPSQVVK